MIIGFQYCSIMFPAASLLTTLLLALSIAASPVEIRSSPITLPIARRLNTSGGTINLLQHDQSRAAALKNVGEKHPQPSYCYIAAVGVGSPATTYYLIVDTGSSNTWTSTSVDTGEAVAVTYGSGSFSGTEYTDTVTLGDGLTITPSRLVFAATSEGFTGVDGILGIGPLDLTEGTLTKEPDTTIPTVTDNFVGVSFEPTTSESDANGELTFGGTDATKYTGDIAYTPLTTTYPASYYWGINESITYGTTTILAETAGIVDTGTTLILIATNAYSEYQSATGATEDNATGLLRLTTAKYDDLEDLNFNVGSSTYALTPNGQIWPRALNTYIGGSSDYVYLIVNSIGTPSGEGLDFINGYTFLERFYSVFDTTNSQVRVYAIAGFLHSLRVRWRERKNRNDLPATAVASLLNAVKRAFVLSRHLKIQDKLAIGSLYQGKIARVGKPAGFGQLRMTGHGEGVAEG
ncbi:aspartic peptidase domain-containing protein [Suillus subaureus]|uniref:Aspartic peptidase domain-containing protein n=1 Tax=Suillus subaureus TaxID=48587 RepID=A0A9P7JJE8_9AGAM|nr:aspartic peptidase domain-containing protein [Suillus subaureus]KAG1826298.1 aspartic peptidase domain-containing protein [Suillus subaureus]